MKSFMNFTVSMIHFRANLWDLIDSGLLREAPTRVACFAITLLAQCESRVHHRRRQRLFCR